MSSKFPVAVQITMIIAALSNDRKVNSELISESIGVNAVIIRNIFKGLKEANIISVSPGPGGAVLARNASEISLLDIFLAVETLDTKLKLPSASDKHMQIGSNINDLLENHLNDGINAMKLELSKVTIEQMAEELRAAMPELPPLPKKD